MSNSLIVIVMFAQVSIALFVLRSNRTWSKELVQSFHCGCRHSLLSFLLSRGQTVQVFCEDMGNGYSFTGREYTDDN